MMTNLSETEHRKKTQTKQDNIAARASGCNHLLLSKLRTKSHSLTLSSWVFFSCGTEKDEEGGVSLKFLFQIPASVT